MRFPIRLALVVVVAFSSHFSTAKAQEVAAQSQVANNQQSTILALQKILENDKRLGSIAASKGQGKVVEAIGMFVQNDANSTKSILEEARKLDPQLPSSTFLISRLFLAVNNIQNGARVLEQCAIETPNDPLVYLTFGEIAEMQNRVTDADVHFRKVLELTTGANDSNQIRVIKASTYRGMGNIASRRRQTGDALELYRLSLQQDPTDKQSMLQVANTAFQLGQVEESTKYLNLLAAVEPTILPDLQLAIFSANTPDQARTIQWFDSALKDEKNAARVHFEYAKWLINTGDFSNAMSHAGLVNNGDQTDPALRFLKAQISMGMQLYTAAEVQLESLHQQSPAEMNVSNLLALALLNQNDQAKIQRGAELALVNSRVNPKNVNTISTLAWAQFQLKNYEQAELLLNRVISTGTMPADGAYLLAILRLQQNRLPEAKQLVEAALSAKVAFLFRDSADVLRISIDKAIATASESK